MLNKAQIVQLLKSNDVAVGRAAPCLHSLPAKLLTSVLKKPLAT